MDGYPGPVIVLFSIEIPRASPETTGATGSQSDGAERQAIVCAVVDASLFTPLGASHRGEGVVRDDGAEISSKGALGNVYTWLMLLVLVRNISTGMWH